MKRIYSNWFVRITLGFAAITSIRLVSTLLHMTTLEKLYKPRDFRRASHLDISQEVVDQLPRYCYTFVGQKVDPVNIIFIGTESGIKRAFEKCGWHEAHPNTPVHLLYGLITAIFNKPYKKGPFTPFFISVGTQDLNFQKSTQIDSYRQRHHIRIWRTKHEIKKGNRIWVGAASFDVSLRLDFRPPFLHHHIDPELDKERDMIVDELVNTGHSLSGSHQMNKPILKNHKKHNAFGAPYYTDGIAKVVEIN